MPSFITHARRVVLAAAACAAPLLAAVPVSAEPTDAVWLTFDELTDSEGIAGLTNQGSAPLSAQLVSEYGGTVGVRESLTTGGLSLRFPTYDGTAAGARAVLAITDAGDLDRLSPGAEDFVFGADVRVRAESEGTEYDNGNNVVQRGLSGDAAQFKLQVDGFRPSCRVKGALGAETVVAEEAVEPGVTYRLRCFRTTAPEGGEYVGLRVTRLEADATVATSATSVSPLTVIGTLAFEHATPLTLGGKVETDSTIADASDQLNGRLDNVVLRVR